MNITTGSVEEHGSCNFCEKGKLVDGKRVLTFPYETVVILMGKQVSVKFCQECFDKLKKIDIQ